jgi:uncharacterized protein
MKKWSEPERAEKPEVHSAAKGRGNPFRVSVRAVREADGPYRILRSGFEEGLEGTTAFLRAGSGAVLGALLEISGRTVSVRGKLEGNWDALCSRCLVPLEGRLVVEVNEALQCSDEEVDLAPLVRDLVLVNLPWHPLCREDCLGLCPRCGGNRNEGECSCEGPEPDPRWGPLGELKF